ncbi:MAG: prephenate dehydratase [Gimesia sp.]|uniref:Bifunctional chorismate mutase/prephenate dehydratase n=1 Tax=Gimesia maris TaxID=122 RepID=A0A3D3RB25_9PLAN|nr:prephenate dehydratase [Gimesia sp.]HCO25999.1 prephenate dehydratase [Gimesia maris]|tara:strand:- start:35951 stop:37120 length:1170 start_codon:yes stop_codon:yes gene_type:complete
MAKKKAVNKRTSVSKPKTSTKKKVARTSPSTKRNPASTQSELKKIDREIIKLVNKRCSITVKQIKSDPEPRKAMFDPKTDEELRETIEKLNGSGPLTNNAIRGIFRQILSSARRQIHPQRVAYLGPAYSYTHLAALERFGEGADMVPVNTIGAVFEEVNRGNTEFGVVPIENSTDGRVVDTLDMFTRLPLRICGEVLIAVHHNLLARCERSEITEIYSKPQALSQCREWLSRNMPQAHLHEVTSTSTAAQLAATKPGAAAVASHQASVEYDLQIIVEGIEDNANNVTRFAVIGEEVCNPTGKDRTAILVQIAHKAGSLADTLQIFKKNKVNLTWIESFPLRGEEPGYLFFIDFEGHVQEPHIKRTLNELEKRVVRLETMGSYPRSGILE